jgi:hypothetical protein
MNDGSGELVRMFYMNSTTNTSNLQEMNVALRSMSDTTRVFPIPNPGVIVFRDAPRDGPHRSSSRHQRGPVLLRLAVAGDGGRHDRIEGRHRLDGARLPQILEIRIADGLADLALPQVLAGDAHQLGRIINGQRVEERIICSAENHRARSDPERRRQRRGRRESGLLADRARGQDQVLHQVAQPPRDPRSTRLFLIPREVAEPPPCGAARV